MRWQPDPTFYPSPSVAMEAPAEKLAYVALLNPSPNGHGDAMGVIDVDPASRNYGQLVGRVDMPHTGDELHHFGWNACSSCLCPYSPHPHMERRYLVVPGLCSSRLYILDISPDPKNPKIVKVIEPETVMKQTGYSRLHTVHCGPEGIYVNALGAPDGEGPGGVFVVDAETFDVRGRWEMDRGPQYLAYDFAWDLGHDTMITIEWGTPNMFENGLNPELLLGGKYGHQIPRLGFAQTQTYASPRSRRRTTVGLRTEACAKSDERRWLCRSRDLSQGSLVFSVALVQGQRRARGRMEGPEGD